MTSKRGPRWRMLAALAWRESRTARRRLLLYMSSISLGVAALVAIDSFAGNVTSSVRDQSRSLLGGDVAFSSRQPFPAPFDTILDSLSAAGTPVSKTTSFASMALVGRTDGTRLVQVRSVTDEFPLYGDVLTEPPGVWNTLKTGRNTIVDPALLNALSARVGDTLQLGFASFRIIGTLRTVPGEIELAAAIGPRVYIPMRYLEETQLLVFGSRAQHEAMLKLRDDQSPQRMLSFVRQRLDSSRVRGRTAAQTEVDLTDAIDQLAGFLGIVGLIALLLGGIGVASGVNAFVARKIDAVAILRCLGATSGQVLAVYVAQAAAMGVLGAAAGVVLGIGVQFLLPHVLSDFLPVDVSVSLVPRAIVLGLLVGLWVAMVFSLLSLLRLRNISPLQALRRDADADVLRQPWRDVPRLAVVAALVLSVVAIAILRTGDREDGLGLTAAIIAVMGALWVSATALSAGARRMIRGSWPYVVRQGIANLHRPANQTRPVVLALGFGVFLVTALYLVQTNLLRQFEVTAEASAGNLVFFDIQDDQAPGVDSLVRAGGYQLLERVPIVTMRVAEINGRTTRELLGDRGRRGGNWALRREYRSTFRDEMSTSEKLLEGRWLVSPTDSGGMNEVSLEFDVASELGVQIGDTITWNVQGVRVPTILTSLREVNWARFEPNFFAVFTPPALIDAPKQYAFIANVPDEDGLARLQRAVVDRYPNVASVDLSLVRRTIQDIVDKVTVAMRFMALFSLAMAVPVLFSAVAATRRERMREGVLLKTLGATRAQIQRIMVAEYLLLGVLGSMTGAILGIAGAWGLVHFIFDGNFVPVAVPAVAIALLMIGLTVTIGLLTGREVFRETPMAALREG
jgi:putative ABC transport system permease protein